MKDEQVHEKLRSEKYIGAERREGRIFMERGGKGFCLSRPENSPSPPIKIADTDLNLPDQDPTHEKQNPDPDQKKNNCSLSL